MITMYTVWNNKILHKKYYKFNTKQTRSHYILTLRQANVGKQRILDIIKQYNTDFENHSSIPYDEDFYFVVEECPIYGGALDMHFYVYSFTINAEISTSVVFTKDNYEHRCDFVDEVKGYLRENEYYDLYNNLMPFLESFKEKDNQYLTVEKNTFSMKKEDN